VQSRCGARAYETLNSNTKGPDGNVILAPENQEAEANGQITSFQRDIDAQRKQFDDVLNQIADLAKKLSAQMADFKSGKMLKDKEAAYKDTAVPTDFNKMVQAEIDADEKYHDDQVKLLQQNLDKITGKLAESQKNLGDAQQREQKIMKTLGPLRAKYQQQEKALEAATKAAKC